MGEISWGRAFGYAIRFILYSLAWWIIGGILVGVGFAMVMGGTAHSRVLGAEVGYGLLIGGVVLIIIGWIIMTLGSIATFFKLMSKLIVESTVQR